MAHFAQLDENNKVIQVIVINNDETYDQDGLENEALGVTFCQKLYGVNTKWVQTSYNGSMRGVFAGIGMTYDAEKDEFIGDSTPAPQLIESIQVEQTAIEGA